MLPLREETARSMNSSSTGRAWMSVGSYISLNEIQTANADFRGCHVEWSSGIGNPNELDFEKAIKVFEDWADDQVERGTFTLIRKCVEPDDDYFHVLESRTNPDRAIRVVINYMPRLNYLFMIAAESGPERPPEDC